ncbi:hypothetical protein V502_05685 [Pseudogymnoascus sp. VKM F-4520 (FW-2644)]|nr:hypothetical protein V502_05685 [Pseudogymnoascus sp. VKM F-4520 (FW-2644)]
MALYKVDPNPIPDLDDNSTVYTAATPPESVATDTLDDPNPTSASVPWPGSTFIIRSISSGRVITLLDGQIVLAPPGGRGSIHWVCEETKGWLGFQNLASGRFLGHNMKGRLCCSVERHLGWENFCARGRPEGGYVLLMTYWESLWQVGSFIEGGVEKLGKIEGSDGIVWNFVKV